MKLVKSFLRMKRLNFWIGIAIMITGLTLIVVDDWPADAATHKQVMEISDECAYRSTVNNQFQTEIYTENGVVTYRISDLKMREVLELREATAREVMQYERQCSDVDTARDNLKVSAVALQACIDDMRRTIVTNDRIQECVMLNAQTQLNLIRTNGLIE